MLSDPLGVVLPAVYNFGGGGPVFATDFSAGDVVEGGGGAEIEFEKGVDTSGAVGVEGAEVEGGGGMEEVLITGVDRLFARREALTFPPKGVGGALGLLATLVAIFGSIEYNQYHKPINCIKGICSMFLSMTK